MEDSALNGLEHVAEVQDEFAQAPLVLQNSQRSLKQPMIVLQPAPPELMGSSLQNHHTTPYRIPVPSQLTINCRRH